jgi:hypothetical protein
MPFMARSEERSSACRSNQQSKSDSVPSTMQPQKGNLLGQAISAGALTIKRKLQKAERPRTVYRQRLRGHLYQKLDY